MTGPGQLEGLPGAAAPPAGRAPTALPVLQRPATPSWRLLVTLGGAGAIAGLLIVLVYGWTAPRVAAHRAAVLRTAIEEVLRAPARADTLYLHGGALVARPPAGVDGADLERVYVGYDDGGRPAGYAITASSAGFADQVGLIFGYDPERRQLLGIKILSTKETPGLGDKIERPGFTDQFRGRVAPLRGVKGAAGGDDASAVVMVTGATISSRTVIRGINDAVVRWQPLIDAYRRGRQ